MTADVEGILLARHEQIPPRAAAAARVLQLVDDPDTSAKDLARAMGTDPVFAARVLRVANSPYYGLSGRVSTLPFAVSVIGFQTVRSLAVVAAAGLDRAHGTPAGFWRSAALTATGAELIAGLIDASAGDAFCLGLLHTIGAALLHQHQALPALCVPSPDDVEELLAAERQRYGISHDQFGARVLLAWHFPESLCAMIGRHHDTLLPGASSLERTLHAARVLADVLSTDRQLTPAQSAHLAWLTEGRLSVAELPGTLSRMSDRASVLLDGLVPRR